MKMKPGTREDEFVWEGGEHEVVDMVEEVVIHARKYEQTIESISIRWGDVYDDRIVTARFE